MLREEIELVKQIIREEIALALAKNKQEVKSQVIERAVDMEVDTEKVDK